MQRAAIVLAAAFMVSALVRKPGFNFFLDVILYFSVGMTAAALCFGRAWLIRDRERGAWFAFALAITSFVIGDMYWTAMYATAANPPDISYADIGYLGFYPFAYAGVLLLIRARMKSVPRSLWLDGIVGGLAAASISAAVFFGPIADSAQGSTLEAIINLSYPMGDLLLLALVVFSFAANGWRPDRSWLLLGLGICVLAFTDTLYLFQIAKNTYVEGTPLDAGWIVAFVIVGLATWRRPRRSRGLVLEHWSIIAVPTSFAFAALVVLTGDRIWHSPTVSMALALGAVVAAFGRVSLTLREVRVLAESRREARTDELTSLGNRRMFYERTTSMLRRRGKKPLALLLIDLDSFKEVNDSLGHHFGDNLLRQIGPRLAEALRGEDVIARLGGDEFAVILDGVSEAVAVETAKRIERALDTPFQLDGVPVRISASIGIAMYPDHAADTNLLLRHADVAMYAAKGAHSGHSVYEAEQDEHSRARLNTINELRRALERKQVVVHYQPKVSAHTNKFAGAEALVRMVDPRKGIVPPDHFLPLAEQAGLMKLLTAHVLDIVLDDIASWAAQGKQVKVAVNLSVTNLLDAEFPQRVAEGLAKRGLPGQALTFEITETTVLSDPDRALIAVNQLRALGADISLDDYGTGYASIAYLRQLPLDELKMDRSFVNDLDSDEVAQSFFASTVSLAHTLKLRVVAEGIETSAMWDAVRAAGCDVGQGFFFARPLTFDIFSAEVLGISSSSTVAKSPEPASTH